MKEQDVKQYDQKIDVENIGIADQSFDQTNKIFSDHTVHYARQSLLEHCSPEHRANNKNSDCKADSKIVLIQNSLQFCANHLFNFGLSEELSFEQNIRIFLKKIITHFKNSTSLLMATILCFVDRDKLEPEIQILSQQYFDLWFSFFSNLLLSWHSDGSHAKHVHDILATIHGILILHCIMPGDTIIDSIEDKVIDIIFNSKVNE